MRTLLLIPVLVLAGGCTATYHEPAPPRDHPANPSAESTAAAPESRALATPAAAGTTSPGTSIGQEHGGAPSPPGEAAAMLYACFMHPEVTSDQPGQRCPKCGMKLVKREGAAHP